MKRHKKGIALIAAIATMLTSGIFVSTPKTVHAEDLSGDGYLILEKLEWQCDNPNKNNLQIGERFQVIATVKNNTKETKTIDPAECENTWRYPDYVKEDGSIPNIGYTGRTEEVEIKPAESKQLVFSYEIDKYAVPSRRTYEGFTVATTDGYRICYFINEKSTDEVVLDGCLQGDEGGKMVHTYDYSDRCLDFALWDAPTPDMDFPVLRSMTTTTGIVEPFETVTYQLEFDDYGYALPNRIWVTFRDIKNEKNEVELAAWIKYSEALGTYTCTLKLNSLLAKGTYDVIRVKVADEADNARGYWHRKGTDLEDYHGNIIEVPDLIIGEKPSYTLGDINADGKINIQDIMLCMDHCVGRNFLEGNQFFSADITGDGAVRVDDLMRIMDYVLGKTQTL